MIASHLTQPPLMRAAVLRAACLSALASLAGCGQADGGAAMAGDGSAGAASGSGAAGHAGQPAAHDGGAAGLVGSFLVKLVAQREQSPAYTSLLGKLFDAPPPPVVPLVLDSQEGDCELLVPEIPFCDPACRDGVCTADGVCTPFPVPQSAGTVRVRGLGEPLELEPVGSSFTYMPAAALAYPPCAEGDTVSVQADAFELEASCIAPLALPQGTIRVRSGESTAVTWTAGAVPDARMRIVLDISHHGGQKGEIDCNVQDTGAFQIPEALVTKLVSLGVAGFPTVVVSRVASATAETLAVTLTVSAEVERPVDTGFVSCIDDADCPDGMGCDPVALICSE